MTVNTFLTSHMQFHHSIIRSLDTDGCRARSKHTNCITLTNISGEHKVLMMTCSITVLRVLSYMT